MIRRSIRGLMVSGASCALAVAIGTPALAQDTAAPATTSAPSGDEPAIIVTGIRGSLQRNLDIKRNAAGVLDAISSEDIGKFPDPNVAASLQRLPGVSVQVSGNRGEATGVTVRGFSGDFNETLYDERHISTATGNRAVDFSTVGSDFVGQLNVYKTPDVSLSASAIGATIDIAFPKPFDHPGLHMAASVSGSIQDRKGNVVPSGGLLVSDTFADDTMGVLGDIAYSRHDTTTNHVFVNGWEGGYYAPCQLAGSTAASCNPGSTTSGLASDKQTVLGWFPQQAGAEQNTTRDERVDARLVYQWKPSDRILLTIDDNFSSQVVQTTSYGYAAWFNMSSLTNVKQDSNGTAIDFNQAGTPMDMNAVITHSLINTNQLGANLKYQVTDHLKLDVDAAFAKSWLNPNGEIGNNSSDIGYGGTLGANTGLAVGGASSGYLPVLHDIGPSGNAGQFLDTSVIGSHVMVRQAQRNTDVVRQFHVKGAWEQENFILQFGGSYMQDTFRLAESDTFTNDYWQAYAGYGTPSGRTTGVALPSSIYGGTISTANFIPGYSGNLAPGILVYNPLAVYNYLQSLGNPQTKNIPGFNYCARPPGTDGLCNYTGSLDLALSPSSVATITEKTWAAYVRANFTTQIASMPFHFISGLRYENTHLDTLALGQTPVSLTTSTADPTLLTTVYANGGATSTIAAGNSYNYLLPSMDLKLEVTPKLHLRLDASRTLTRPALKNLNPVLNVGSGQRVGALTATGGNPDLSPYLSDNFDAAAEWYYAPNSYFSVDFFLKHVSNFIVAGVQRQTINGVIDPTTGQAAQFSVSQQVNGPDATVRGVEIALQHVFGRSGFGLTANATFVGTNKPYDPKDISTSGFAVTGLANSANLVAFYDKHGFQVRVAVNWRDSYLLQFGQNQNTGQFGAEPTFVNSQVQVDLSSSYDITKNVSVFGGITNLNNSVYSTHGRFSNQLLDAYSYGRRFTFGARYHF
ncbi:TonB-dependent receptor [Novosphingobium terrae]|uniref:TonB-dependent receptor n=1 Tax=Novosphingobium terrae TaxID=2726189 RepID=UPI00198234E4|nr:TonB-dependent receptor [Novosphingobium terrae]